MTNLSASSSSSSSSATTVTAFSLTDAIGSSSVSASSSSHSTIGSSSDQSHRLDDHRLHRPPFPTGWQFLDLTPQDLVLAHTLPVGQSFLWHKRSLSLSISEKAPASSVKASSDESMEQQQQQQEDRKGIAIIVAKKKTCDVPVKRKAEDEEEEGTRRTASPPPSALSIIHRSPPSQQQEPSFSSPTRQRERRLSSVPSVGVTARGVKAELPHPGAAEGQEQEQEEMISTIKIKTEEKEEDDEPSPSRSSRSESSSSSPSMMIREEYSRAIGGGGGGDFSSSNHDVDPILAGPPRILCLRQDERSGRVWYTSICPSQGSTDADDEQQRPIKRRRKASYEADVVVGGSGVSALSMSDLDLAFLRSYFRFDLVPPTFAINAPTSLQSKPRTSSPPSRRRTLGEWYSAWTRADPLLFGRLQPAPPQGIRVLRQDPWETLLAFITSSANNVPRITGCLQRLARELGPEVGRLGLPTTVTRGADEEEEDGELQTYHLFPRPRDLLAVCHAGSKTDTPPDFSLLDARLRQLGFGYRAGFIASTLQTLWEAHGSEEDGGGVLQPSESSDRSGIERHLASLRQKPGGDDSMRWRSELLSFKGVGRKVADCIGLMSLDAHQAVPIDTHLQQIAARHPKFPARLKTKSTSTEKVYAEVQAFLEGLWESEEAPGMAGWAQAVMFAADLKGSTSIAAATSAVKEEVKAKVEAVHELEVKAEEVVKQETSVGATSPRTPARRGRASTGKRRPETDSPSSSIEAINDASPASTVLLTPMSSVDVESKAVDYLESGSVWDDRDLPIPLTAPVSLAESVKMRKRSRRT